jgi:excisionase family DNA binding protein
MERVLYTPHETADMLRVCRTTVYGLIRDGELRSVNIGRRRLIPATAIEAYIESLGKEN